MSDNDIKCVLHFSKKSVNDKISPAFITDYYSYTADFNDNYKIAGGRMSDMLSGSMFSNKKSLQKVCVDFKGMKRISHLFDGCDDLSYMYHATDVGIENNNTNNCIVHSFNECISIDNSFKNLGHIFNVKLELPKCLIENCNFIGCSNLTSVSVNYHTNDENQVSYPIILNYEFAKCNKLNSLCLNSFTKNINNKDVVYGNSCTEDALSKLICGKGAFEGCSSLENFGIVLFDLKYSQDTLFRYKLNSLMCGKNMFSGCNFNSDSVTAILESLPDLYLSGKVMNDYSLSDDEVNSYLKSLNRWNCVERKNGAFFVRLKIFSSLKDKQNDEKNDEDFLHKIHFKDFGVIDFGVSKIVENIIDAKSTNKSSSKLAESIRNAIAKGWKITYNGKSVK